MASAGHLVSGRARLQGKQTGVLSFNAPDKAGAYQLRMFDAGSGKEIASYNFTAGSDAYLLSGIYLEQRRDNKKYFIKIEVYDNGSSARFLSRDYKDSTRWVEYLTGKVVGNTIFYMLEITCGYGPDGRTAGQQENPEMYHSGWYLPITGTMLNSSLIK